MLFAIYLQQHCEYFWTVLELLAFYTQNRIIMGGGLRFFVHPLYVYYTEYFDFL